MRQATPEPVAAGREWPMTAGRGKATSARRGAVAALLFLAVAAINAPRIPRFADYAAAGWLLGGALLLTALGLAISNYRGQVRAGASD